jgi:hypothetical protein
MFEEHDRIILTGDVAEEGLKEGDVGTIVHVYGDANAFEVEFLTLDGDTAAIVTVSGELLRPVNNTDITHARSMQVSA